MRVMGAICRHGVEMLKATAALASAKEPDTEVPGLSGEERNRPG